MNYGNSGKMPDNYVVDAALHYAGIGWSVIPIKPDQKVPYIRWKDFQTQRATEEQIKKWWGEYPQARIGIVTGKISNLLVVDFDNPEAQPFEVAENCKPQLHNLEIKNILKSALSYSKGPFFKCTDTGNGERQVQHYGKNIRYSHDWDKWLVWSGRRWKIDKIGSIK